MNTFESRFVGREYEIREIKKCYNSGRSEFIALYGRRRVGKTFLIRNLFSKEFSFYVSGVLCGTKKEELYTFYDALIEYGYKGERPKDWSSAFYALNSLIQQKEPNRRCVVFFDEISAFDTPKSGFVKALEHFWNVKGSAYDNLLFIISGSATHWIIDKVINDRGGLHNRVTKQIHLRPFKLKEVEEYGKKNKSPWERIQYLEMYSALGGVPFYWDKIDFSLPVSENIDNLFFNKNAELPSEFLNLYRSLFKKSEPYIDVINILFKNKNGLTRDEIIECLGKTSNSGISRILEDLENCDFIRKYYRSGKKNGAIYQLIDFFSIFYLQFIHKMKKDNFWWRKNMLSPKVNTWYGLSFERVAMEHVDEILYSLHLDSINTEVYSWRSKNDSPRAQIDLVIDRADSMVTLCEAKYSKGEYRLDKDEYLKLENRIEAFRRDELTKTRKGVQLVLITTFGLCPSQYSGIFSKVLTIDDLFV